MSDSDFRKDVLKTINELSRLYLEDIRARNQLSKSAIPQEYSKPLKTTLYEAEWNISRNDSHIRVDLFRDKIEKAAKSLSRRHVRWAFLVHMDEKPLYANDLIDDPDYLWGKCAGKTKDENDILALKVPTDGLCHALTCIAFSSDDGRRMIDGEIEFTFNAPAKTNFESIQTAKKQLGILLSDHRISKNIDPKDFGEELAALSAKRAEMLEALENNYTGEDKTFQLEKIRITFDQKIEDLIDKNCR